MRHYSREFSPRITINYGVSLATTQRGSSALVQVKLLVFVGLFLAVGLITSRNSSALAVRHASPAAPPELDSMIVCNLAKT